MRSASKAHERLLALLVTVIELSLLTTNDAVSKTVPTLSTIAVELRVSKLNVIIVVE